MEKNKNLLFSLAYYLLTILLFLLINSTIYSAEIQIPKQSDWKNLETVLMNGTSGSWDYRLHGQISPCAVIKQNGTYFLYYIGADGNRSNDGGPRHRAIGVATSNNGINFTKYSGNPILTFLPHQGSSLDQEEGVFSAGATLDENGEFLLYYGAMTATSSTDVVDDVRLATSNDGLSFTDLGVVVSHSNSSVWGHGDELFSVGTFYSNDLWYVYYIAKGSSAFWDLALAWGTSRDNLPNTQPVLTAGSYIISGCDPVWLSDDKIAFFIVRDFNKGIIEVRTASINSPGQLSAPIEIYDFGSNWRHATVFLDRETNTWFMYHREKEGNTIWVRSAQAVSTEDTTPPTISSVTADETSVMVVFSEPVEQTSAETISNYTIDNGITISNAILNADLRSITLITNPHTDGTTYTLTINNVRDRASTPNTIAPNSIATYTYTLELIVTNLNQINYQTAYLNEGDIYYIDRTFTITNIPSPYQNLLWIKTANNDKASTGTAFLTFDVNQPVTVYIAYDQSISSIPTWLANWNNEGQLIQTSDTTLNLYSKNFPQGQIALGGNYGTSNDSMYTVLIKPLGQVGDTIPPAPPTGLEIIP
jgi:hypothetical protein